ncbi:MAG: HAD family hydrolase [Acidobacteriota bacterium]
MTKMLKMQLDVLVYDIDGVLIDVTESYRHAIRLTVQLYLEAALGLAPFEGELVSPEDVAAFKMAGGFNNDWDLTTGLLYYFASLVDAIGVVELHKNSAEVLAYLRWQGAAIHTNVADLYARKNIGSFARQLRNAGGGLQVAKHLLSSRNAHLVFAEGDPRGMNLVKRIFEEVYLGSEFFTQEYGQAPSVFIGPGLIRRERPIAGASALDAVGTRAALGIATGRPRNQAIYALETTGMRKRFRSLVTHEDVVAAEEKQFGQTGRWVNLSKPHPYTLLEAVRRITPGRVRCAYIGDTLDDIQAANAAKKKMDFISIGCLAPAADKEGMREEFERTGADVVVEHPDDLVQLLNE